MLRRTEPQEDTLGSFSTTLDNLAQVYQDQRRYAEAESLYQRALAIREQALPPNHPNISTTLNNLALLYQDQGKYAEAETLYQQALAIYEQVLGANHRSTQMVRQNYTLLLQDFSPRNEQNWYSDLI